MFGLSGYIYVPYVSIDLFSGSPIPATLRQDVYMYGMMEAGDEDAWNTLWARYEVATSAQDKLYLLRGLASTPHLWLIQR